MKWVIHTNFVDNRICIESDEGFPIGKTKSFRLIDADDIVWFQGIAEADKYRMEGFEPLDNFGVNHGCVDIQYLDNNEWISL